MAYCGQADLEERYGSNLLLDLTDRADPPAGAIDAGVVNRAIVEADALIDGYLKGRYVLPLDSTPPLIATLSRQIAIYVLHPYEPNEKIRRDYEAALKQLRDIAQGTIQLDVAGVTPAQTGAGGARITDRERPFTDDNLKGWI